MIRTIINAIIFTYLILIITGFLGRWVAARPKGHSWRCHAGFHGWDTYGHRMQCRRCGKRKNKMLDEFRMRLDQLRMSIHQYKGSRTQDWQTPKWLYDQLNERYGPFNLDPCTSEDNPMGTEYFYTEEMNGIADYNQWIIPEVEMTRFYMNPPYGRETKHWVKKAHEQTQKWKPKIMGVGLLPARTDPKWFHNYILPYYEIIFLPGRIAFIDPETGKPVKGTNFASMLVIYR